MSKRLVHWFEGMFLKPHHFQASDRYWHDRVRESEDWHHPHDWGVRQVQIDPEALANSRLVVRSCQVRFKDGTTLSLPDDGALDGLDLRALMGSRSDLTILLALPSWQPGRPNIAGGDDGQGARFDRIALECGDENTGSDEESLEFRTPRVRLLPGHIDVTGFELLPLVRLRRSSREEAPPEIDPTFIPSLLGVDAWAPLVTQLDQFYQQLQAVVRKEAEYLVGRKLTFDSQILGESERILKLAVCNAALAQFQGTLFTRGLHPFELYRDLCRLVGELSLFDGSRRPPELPAYDHDDLGTVYPRVLAELRRLLGAGLETPVEKRYFQRPDREFFVQLDQDWMSEKARLYIGIETTELMDNECDELIRTTDWKLGSIDEISSIFKNAMPGLGMIPLVRIPAFLPRDVVYFDIDRSSEKHRGHWRDVLRTRTLAIRFRLDTNRFKTESIVTLTSPKTGREVDLKFAVYLVRGS